MVPANGELAPVPTTFNYGLVPSTIAQQVRSSADHIRELVKKSLEDLIAIGRDLIFVKNALDHGHFGRWLQAEFGWTDRMARNFIAVAERFGKSEIISDLRIQPTAAYLLAAASAPDEARQVAIDRATSGENITAKVAKDILAKARKKHRRKTSPLSLEKLGQQLQNSLWRYRERWNPRDYPELVRHLREFADTLDRDRKKKRSP